MRSTMIRKTDDTNNRSSQRDIPAVWHRSSSNSRYIPLGEPNNSVTLLMPLLLFPHFPAEVRFKHLRTPFNQYLLPLTAFSKKSIFIIFGSADGPARLGLQTESATSDHGHDMAWITLKSAGSRGPIKGWAATQSEVGDHNQSASR